MPDFPTVITGQRKPCSTRAMAHFEGLNELNKLGQIFPSARWGYLRYRIGKVGLPEIQVREVSRMPDFPTVITGQRKPCSIRAMAHFEGLNELNKLGQVLGSARWGYLRYRCAKSRECLILLKPNNP
ncbi:hypothetical protein Ddc_20775 [Ditylenchus destructor]|nr:hypothetical protein Ddc_20775 [Ditylenchus destructor]